MKRLDIYILAHRQTEGTRKKNEIIRSHEMLLGGNPLREYEYRFHVVTDVDKLRGHLFDPSQVHFARDFYDNPNSMGMLSLVRYIIQMDSARGRQ